MRTTYAIVVGIALVAGCGPRQAEFVVRDLPPYPLPADVEQSMATLGSEFDLLLVGETHGTQEVPAVVEALIAPLTKLGYRALALEIPYDQQAGLAAWATGTTGEVPTFFANPGPDGRGNEQLLALVRCALRPPYQWKLICFDITEAEMMEQMMASLPTDTKRSIAETAARLSPDDFVAISIARDAIMAERLATGMSALGKGEKGLAICGNLHARTADHSPADSPLKPLWPSTAAVLARDHPEWRIRSINVQAFGGEYFNGGKVNKFSERPLEKVEIHQTANADWDVELNLPRATATTFLQTPASMVAQPE